MFVFVFLKQIFKLNTSLPLHLNTQIRRTREMAAFTAGLFFLPLTVRVHSRLVCAANLFTVILLLMFSVFSRQFQVHNHPLLISV